MTVTRKIYQMAITELGEADIEEFRFYVRDRDVKIQWCRFEKNGRLNAQNIILDAWFDENRLIAYGLDPRYDGGTFNITVAREMWDYLYRTHSAYAKKMRRQKA